MHDDLAIQRHRFWRMPVSLLAIRPVAYIAIVLVTLALAYGYTLRRDGIFACQATGYSSDWYLAECSAPSYGNYEHGAFWFGLEPAAIAAAARADVMFLGESRNQVAFSTAASADWFASIAAHYYLMGFGYRENMTFEDALLQKVHPQAKAYVINLESFFETVETAPASAVLHDPAQRARYEMKKLWQIPHRFVCGLVEALCRGNPVVFRARSTGAYEKADPSGQVAAASYNRFVNFDVANQTFALARDFLARLPVGPECVILTAVPHEATGIETAKVVAKALHMELIAPELDGLRLFDASHMDRPSAERWSAAFFQEAAPRIRKCLGRS